MEIPSEMLFALSLFLIRAAPSRGRGTASPEEPSRRPPPLSWKSEAEEERSAWSRECWRRCFFGCVDGGTEADVDTAIFDEPVPAEDGRFGGCDPLSFLGVDWDSGLTLDFSWLSVWVRRGS